MVLVSMRREENWAGIIPWATPEALEGVQYKVACGDGQRPTFPAGCITCDT